MIRFEDIFKARKAYPIGTERQFGGKLYIKTSKGWRPKSKKVGSLQQEIKDQAMEIITNMRPVTKELIQDYKKYKSLIYNIATSLLEEGNSEKSVGDFLKNTLKLKKDKDINELDEFLGTKAYYKHSESKFSDRDEVAEWLMNKVQRLINNPNSKGETLSANDTKELVNAFNERYELGSIDKAEKVLKGLAFNGTKDYQIAFDTNMGLYNFYIGKREDVLKKSMEQQFDPEYFEKAKKGASLGTIKEFGGKKYIKAENGWKYYGKKKGSSQEEESSDKPKEVEVESKEKDKVSELDQFATKATDKQLEAAMKDPEQTEAVKKIAKEELEKRKGKSEEETIDLSEKEDKKQVLIDHLKQQVKLTDKQIEVLLSMFSVDEMYKNMKSKEKSQQKEKTEKQSEIKKEDKKEETPKSGFKKITQTYVKVGDGNIIIKMQGDNQYKATKGKFSLLSEPNESLADFKKKVKEQYEDRSKLKEEIKSEIKQELKEEIKPTEKQVKTKKQELRERSIDDKYTKEVAKEYIKEAHGEDEYIDSVVENKFVTAKSKISERDMTTVDRYLRNIDITNVLKSKSDNFYYSEEKMSNLTKLGNAFNGDDKNKTNQLAYNLALIRDGQKPYLSPMFYKEYNDQKYNVYDQSTMDTINAAVKARELCYEHEEYTKEEFLAIQYYTGTGYSSMRKYLMKGQDKNNEQLKEYINNVELFIKKSPLKENVILSRRIEFDDPKAFGFFQSLKPGDIYEDKSFTSFSLSQREEFGNFQITCLAKKGQKFAAVEKFSSAPGESEFVAQKGMKYKVLEVGKNSMVIEVVE